MKNEVTKQELLTYFHKVGTLLEEETCPDNVFSNYVSPEVNGVTIDTSPILRKALDDRMDLINLDEWVTAARILERCITEEEYWKICEYLSDMHDDTTILELAYATEDKAIIKQMFTEILQLESVDDFIEIYDIDNMGLLTIKVGVLN